MNDCIWCWIYACDTDTDKCHGCKEYISVNCDLGNQMLKAYQRDVEEALKPVHEEWARKMGRANNAN